MVDVMSDDELKLRIKKFRPGKQVWVNTTGFSFKKICELSKIDRAAVQRFCAGQGGLSLMAKTRLSRTLRKIYNGELVYFHFGNNNQVAILEVPLEKAIPMPEPIMMKVDLLGGLGLSYCARYWV